MIVACEGCQKRFKLDDARIPEKGARVRCKHCHHRFRVSPPGNAPTEASDSSATSSEAAGEHSIFGEPVPTAGDETSDSNQELRFVNEPLADSSDAPTAEPDAETSAPELTFSQASPVTTEQVAPDTLEESEAVPEGGTWEFADSNLTLDASDPSSDPADDESRPAVEAEAADAVQSEPIDPEPAESTVPGLEPDRTTGMPNDPVVDETPSLRAIAPGAGPDSVLFEMAEGADEGAALELADGPAEASADATTQPPAAGETSAEAADADAGAPAAAPEIGSAADWDALDREAASPEPAALPVAEPASVMESFQDVEPDPDWPEETDDLPEVPVPPARAPRGRVWLEHAGWSLSLLLLLAVAGGTVRIVPRASEPPAGHVEVAGFSAENVRARFVENARSGTLFVVSGDLRNQSGSARRAPNLRVVLLDEYGLALDGSGAPVGAELTEAMVRETPVGALAQQQTLLGTAHAERSLAPGEGVGFHAILVEMPEPAARFRIEESRREAPLGRAAGALPSGESLPEVAPAELGIEEAPAADEAEAG